MKNNNQAIIIDDDQDDQEILSTVLRELDQQLSFLFFSDCASAIAYYQDGVEAAPEYGLD